MGQCKKLTHLLYNKISEVIIMLDLVEIVHQLAERDEVIIKGEPYRLRNVVSATDGEVLKTRFILENIAQENQIAIDVGISAKVYKLN